MLITRVILGLLAALLAFLMYRARTLRQESQRKALRSFYKLSEQIIGASSPAEIVEKLAEMIQHVPKATGARLYLFNRRARCLERVPTAANPEPMVAPIDDPPDGLANVAVVTFRNRTALNIPDIRRNPLVPLTSTDGLPRSAIFVPLMSGKEPIGVLEFDDEFGLGYFEPQDQAAIQHLANQAAAALRLQEQQAMREQLFRGEKMAATGQLISGVASELRAPLAAVTEVSATLARFAGQLAPEASLLELNQEARRALEIVDRLVSFSQPEHATAGAVDVGDLLTGLMRFREPEWRSQDLRVHDRIGAAGQVLGVESQLEQVFLTLLVHAEQRAAQSNARFVALKTSHMRESIVVEIEYSVAHGGEFPHDSPLPDGTLRVDALAPPELAGISPGNPGGRRDGEWGDDDPSTFDELPSAEPGGTGVRALGLDVCKGIIASHGGEIRVHQGPDTRSFQVELPAYNSRREVTAPREASPIQHSLTLLMIDPEHVASRELVTLLDRRGHRVVPSVPEASVDLVQRLPFNAVLWPIRSGQSNWTEYHDKLRAGVPVFILVSEGYDQQLASSLEQNGGFLLSRPIQESSLDRILSEISTRLSQVG